MFAKHHLKPHVAPSEVSGLEYAAVCIHLTETRPLWIFCVYR